MAKKIITPSKIRLNKLKNAIAGADWEEICEFYKYITGGETIEPPSFDVIPLDDEYEKEESVTPPKKKKKGNDLFAGKVSGNFRRANTGQIKFIDDKSTPTYPEDLKNKNKTRTSRFDIGGLDTGKPVHVKCSKCGKSESVSPILAIGYRKNEEDNMYRCDGCTKG